MKRIEPAKLEPIFLPKVWGGRNLEHDLSIPLPEGEQIGEAWLLFDRVGESSRITGSTTTISDWMKHDALSLLGPHCQPTPSGTFPLLLKYLDCAERLSVQCHPDDATAALSNDLGKTEAWVVVGARPGGSLTYGFRPNVTKEVVLNALNTPEIEPLLQRYTPQVGDALLVPAGVVHSPGAGVTLFEVQQNSNLTFRLYDWGRDRELHLEEGAAALTVTHHNPISNPTPSKFGGDVLISSHLFGVRRLSLSEEPHTLHTNEGFLILNPVRGTLSLTWESADKSETMVLNSGETAIIPACTKQVTLMPSGEVTLLITSPGSKVLTA
jgi:mannose-6-phosphate isomerase